MFHVLLSQPVTVFIACPQCSWQCLTQHLLLFAFLLCSPTEIVAFSDRISEFQALNCNVSRTFTCPAAPSAAWQQKQQR
jgi:alkyl hydroperoxide reductase subunit AhpC